MSWDRSELSNFQDPALAVLELIKNSWDANATRVAVTVDQRKKLGTIVVEDNGIGMTTDDFVNRWLVIGASHKRNQTPRVGARPLIGEKGLGRLASFALGASLTVESASSSGQGFTASVDWDKLLGAPSLEESKVPINPRQRRVGTTVEIRRLKSEWKSVHTDFLVTHTEFLTSVPGQKFTVGLNVNGRDFKLEDPLATISRLSEASMEVTVAKDGSPQVQSCVVNGSDVSGIVFRPLRPDSTDPKLAGTRLQLTFFRRDQAARRLGDVLKTNEAAEVLERYQGVRIYRDGINVPPYGLNGDDWAGLEKQRTATGGPTLVPGNSQLIGELHVSRRAHPQLVVTAGRSGFSDQSAVRSLANYVKWAVRELGTARRAEHLGITDSEQTVPTRR